MREQDMYPFIAKWFKDMNYMVRGEVNDCDLVAVKDNQVIIVELKNAFNLSLIMQGVERQRYSDLVYLAIWKPKKTMSKRQKEVIHLVKRLELGLLYVSEHGDISIVCEPKPFDRHKSIQRMKRKRTSLLAEVNARSGDYNIGGSTRTKVITAYKEMSLYIVLCLQKNGPTSIKMLKDLGCDQKKTSSILQKNFEGWFVRESRGIYKLTYKGESAYNDYQYILEKMINKYENMCELMESEG